MLFNFNESSTSLNTSLAILGDELTTSHKINLKLYNKYTFFDFINWFVRIFNSKVWSEFTIIIFLLLRNMISIKDTVTYETTGLIEEPGLCNSINEVWLFENYLVS